MHSLHDLVCKLDGLFLFCLWNKWRLCEFDPYFVYKSSLYHYSNRERLIFMTRFSIKDNSCTLDIYRIWNEFSFHTVFMKRVVCFCIPEPLARGYKTHNEFHKYRMKWKFISYSFYHMLNSQKRKENTVLSSLCLILLRKTCQRRGVTYDVIDELRRLSLSNCFPVLCHKLIYEFQIAIFHSINRETCDRYQCRIQQNVRLTFTYVKLPYKTYVKRTNRASYV